MGEGCGPVMVTLLASEVGTKTQTLKPHTIIPILGSATPSSLKLSRLGSPPWGDQLFPFALGEFPTFNVKPRESWVNQGSLVSFVLVAWFQTEGCSD